MKQENQEAWQKITDSITDAFGQLCGLYIGEHREGGRDPRLGILDGVRDVYRIATYGAAGATDKTPEARRELAKRLREMFDRIEAQFLAGQ